jgi:endonuclease/exonuclease/phosphatase family metal-dependent hydrolase
MPAFLVLMLLLLCSFADVTGLSLASFNIRSGSNINDTYNLRNTAEAINGLRRPLLIGIQEVDNHTARHGDDQPTLLGQWTGLSPHYAVFRDFEGGQYGVLILSSFPVLESRILHYSKKGNPTNASGCAIPQSNDFCQGAIAVLVDTGAAGKLWFVTTHLGLEGVQESEAHQLVSFLRTLGNNVIVTGDFNSTPLSPAVRVISAYLTSLFSVCGTGNAFTFNSSGPFETIDYIFAPSGTSCNSCVVVSTEVSDHRPIVAQM